MPSNTWVWHTLYHHFPLDFPLVVKGVKRLTPLIINQPVGKGHLWHVAKGYDIANQIHNGGILRWKNHSSIAKGHRRYRHAMRHSFSRKSSANRDHGGTRGLRAGFSAAAPMNWCPKLPWKNKRCIDMEPTDQWLVLLQSSSKMQKCILMRFSGKETHTHTCIHTYRYIYLLLPYLHVTNIFT